MQIHRLVAALVTGSLALQAGTASAMSLGLGTSHHFYDNTSLHHSAGSTVSTSAETTVQANGQTQGSTNTSASAATPAIIVATNEESARDEATANREGKIKANMGLHLGWYKQSHTGSTSTNAEVKLMLERKRSMFTGAIKRMVNAVAQLSLRICKAAGGDGNTVKQCLTNRKDAFKVQVNAMIDAAFTISI